MQQLLVTEFYFSTCTNPFPLVVNIKKMKTPKDKDPINSNLTFTTIERLLKQLEKLQILLNQSRTANLTKLKTAISLTKFIKLRLGDTLRFVVYHIERHILQAQKIAIK